MATLTRRCAAEGGRRARIVQPKVTMERVPKQIEKQLVSVPSESPFYRR
jgi:hypothetical protein